MIVRDIQHSGCDERILVALERDYFVDLAEINRGNILRVFAELVAAKGLKDSPELRSVLGDLLLFAQETMAAVPQPKLGAHEAIVRRRLPLLAKECHNWLQREKDLLAAEFPDLHGPALDAQLARIQPKYRAAGASYDTCLRWEGAASNVDALVGCKQGTIRKWCEENAIAAKMLETFRPVRLHTSHITSASEPGDALSAMASVLLGINTRRKRK